MTSEQGAKKSPSLVESIISDLPRWAVNLFCAVILVILVLLATGLFRIVLNGGLNTPNGSIGVRGISSDTPINVIDVPAGAVIAFDKDDGSCPDNTWMNIGKDEAKKFAGRTLVVAGGTVKQEDRQSNENNLNDGTSLRDHRMTGGQEKVRLETQHTAAHSHTVTQRSTYVRDNNSPHRNHNALIAYTGSPNSADGASNKNGGVKTTQPSQPHDNMPPFIALTFCKKLGPPPDDRAQ